MVMFNRTFVQNNGDVFYDALHLLEASLRCYKGTVSHYLDGVPGCGARTEHAIRTQFFETITLITERLRSETDNKRLCLLINALLWDYEASDLQVLANANVFNTLSGTWDGATPFNPLAATWGKEQNYYSVQDLDSVDYAKEASDHG